MQYVLLGFHWEHNGVVVHIECQTKRENLRGSIHKHYSKHRTIAQLAIRDIFDQLDEIQVMTVNEICMIYNQCLLLHR